jgi:hypothetical protein
MGAKTTKKKSLGTPSFGQALSPFSDSFIHLNGRQLSQATFSSDFYVSMFIFWALKYLVFIGWVIKLLACYYF